MKSSYKVLAGCAVLLARVAYGQEEEPSIATSLYDSEALIDLDPDILFDLEEWEEQHSHKELHKKNGARTLEMDNLLGPIFEGVECSACIAAGALAGQVLEKVREQKSSKKKEIFGGKFMSDFDTAFREKLDDACRKMPLSWGESIDAHFKLDEALPTIESYAMNMDQTEMLEAFDKEQVETSLEAYKHLLAGMPNYFTNDIEDIYTEPPDSPPDMRMRTWKPAYDQVLQKWCTIVKESNELDDMIEVYHDEIPRSAQMRICYALDACTEKIKGYQSWTQRKTGVPTSYRKFKKEYLPSAYKKQDYEEWKERQVGDEVNKMEERFENNKLAAELRAKIAAKKDIIAGRDSPEQKEADRKKKLREEAARLKNLAMSDEL